MTRLRLRADLALVLVCVALYVAAAAQVRSPRGSALSLAFFAVTSPIVSAFDSVGAVWDEYRAGRQNFKEMLAEQVRLRAEVGELRRSNQILTSELISLRQGSRLLAAFPSLAGQTVLARVLARDVLGTHTMMLDRGGRDGIKLDAAVLAEHGVIGRVDRLLPGACRVQLLSHPSAAAAARIAGVEHEALLMGGERPTLSGLPPYTKIAPDSPVFTSGSEGIYPPGLVLGTTGEARTEGLFTVVPVQLSAQPAETVVVLVLLPQGGGQ